VVVVIMIYLINSYSNYRNIILIQAVIHQGEVDFVFNYLYFILWIHCTFPDKKIFLCH